MIVSVTHGRIVYMHIHIHMGNVLFVCMGFFIPLENFLVIWRRTSTLPVTGCEFCSEYMAIEQWGFFSVPYPLWHRASIYNDYHREPLTHTPILSSGDVDICFFPLTSVAAEIPTPNLPFWCERSNPLCHRGGNGLMKWRNRTVKSNLLGTVWTNEHNYSRKHLIINQCFRRLTEVVKSFSCILKCQNMNSCALHIFYNINQCIA